MLHANGFHAQARGKFAGYRIWMEIVGGDARFDAGQRKPFF